MLAGVLLRHYKNYLNLNFIPVCNDCNNKFSVYVGDNGVGKSAVLESADLFFNNRQWNITQGTKKTQAYVCPIFFIEKKSVPSTKRDTFEIISDYFWSNKCEENPNVQSVSALQDFIRFRNETKDKYEKTHYFIICGVSYDSGRDAYFGTFDKSIKDLLSKKVEEAQKIANSINDYIWSHFSYLYIPVEESPQQLLQLQHDTMQKLLNKNVLTEIENILTKKEDGSSGGTIVKRINKHLDSFVEEVNAVISGINDNYSFKAESGSKKNLTAKDIRAKIIDAYFPLRTLKFANKNINLLSSGEQRRAVIDIAYSTLIANKGKRGDKEVILAIDEPESSMHISNCFDQFIRLEELVHLDAKHQVLLTTHWYGFLPIVDKGNLHHLSKDSINKQTCIRSFNIFNLFENRRHYPDDVTLKSMFDLASSMLAYMRQHNEVRWIICEGSDDKTYLEAILGKHSNLRVLPVGGCGNVVKLYQMLFGFMTEKNGDNVSKTKALFLIDTDLQMTKIQEPFQFGTIKNNTILRRLQIVGDDVTLLNPLNSGTYSQTEMEDCLNPEIYWKSICDIISRVGNRKTKAAIKHVEFIQEAHTSKLRGDESFICPKESKYLNDKRIIIEFAESNDNKYLIANKYAEYCSAQPINHSLKIEIEKVLELG